MLQKKRVYRLLLRVCFTGLWLSLQYDLAARAEPKPGEMLGQGNWQEAKGLLPDAVLHRFQDGSYQANVVALPTTLDWGKKFKSASETNAGKFDP